MLRYRQSNYDSCSKPDRDNSSKHDPETKNAGRNLLGVSIRDVTYLNGALIVIF